MTPATAAPKPRKGEPCNGCGLCCLVQPCELAVEYLSAPADRPCPALEREGGRFWCGLVRAPVRYLADLEPWQGRMMARGFALLLGVGRGCDAEDDA
jgi:hypothetical protein